MNRHPWKTVLPAVFACFLWSTAAPVIKIGLLYTKPLFLAGLRFLFAGILLIPFSSGWAAYREIFRTQLKTAALVSLFQTVLLYVFFFEGLTLVTGAIGSIVNGATPLVAAVLSHCFRKDDKLTLSRVFRIMLGIAGVIFITLSREPLTAAGFREMAGILLIFLSCICSAAGNILVAGSKTEIHPVALNSLQIGTGGIVLILLSFVFEGVPRVQFAPGFFLALLWLVMVSAAGFSIWFSLLKQDGAKVSELNVWKFILPVFGVLISWVLLPEEKPQWTTAAGMLLVAASVLILYLPGKEKRAAGNSAPG